MADFIQAHAGHADWRIALEQCWSQIRQQLESAPVAGLSLGWCYCTDHYAAQVGAILETLGRYLPGVHWVGTLGIGVAAGPVEYIDEPAMVLLLTNLPAHSFRLFSEFQPLDAQPPGFEPFTALVHAHSPTGELAAELKRLSGQTSTGYLFGGLCSARHRASHFADTVFSGGLSGVAFGPDVRLLSRVTQGCQPIGTQRRITRGEGNILVTLDGQRALDCVLQDLGLPETLSDVELNRALATTLVGLTATGEDVSVQPGAFGTNTEVRHIVGVSRKSGVLVVAEQLRPGAKLAFCRRDAEAAQLDLLRILGEIRRDCGTSARIDGALYISCSGRGGPHFGAPHAEFRLVNRELGGEVPLVGFFAGGEIARSHLYGYTGVLTVFTTPL